MHINCVYLRGKRNIVRYLIAFYLYFYSGVWAIVRRKYVHCSSFTLYHRVSGRLYTFDNKYISVVANDVPGSRGRNNIKRIYSCGASICVPNTRQGVSVDDKS